MKLDIRTRIIVVLATVLVTAGTVMAADPSADPSASASASAAPSSTEASPSPSLSPSNVASVEPSASAQPTPPVGPDERSEPSPSPDATKGPKTEASDEAEGPEAPPTDAEVADFVARLKAAGITTTPADFKALVVKVGVGGAVRTLAFAQASGKTPAQILAMRDGGKGWGKIRKELGLNIGPGIGWIMSGGHGKNH